MEVELYLACEEDAAVTQDLWDWLGNESSLQGRMRWAPNSLVQGQMGALQETLVVSLGAGGAVTALAASLKVWFAQPRRQDIRITIRTKAGSLVEVDARRVDNAEAILQMTIEKSGL